MRDRIPEREDDSSVDLRLKRNIQIAGNPARDRIGIRIRKEVQVWCVRSQVQHRERADGAQEDAHDAGAVHLNTGSTVQVQNLRDDVRLTTRPLGAHKTSSSHVTYSPDFGEGWGREGLEIHSTMKAVTAGWLRGLCRIGRIRQAGVRPEIVWLYQKDKSRRLSCQGSPPLVFRRTSRSKTN